MSTNQYTQRLIGKTISIDASTVSSLQGVVGEVIDESKYTFRVRVTENVKNIKIIKVMKQTIRFHVVGQTTILDGSKMLKRGEERLKMRIIK